MTINDHKYQISTRLPTRAGMFDPLLNCPICLPCLRWPFVDLCNKHRQPPPPVRGGRVSTIFPWPRVCTLQLCHKPDLWLVTRGSGQGPWTCLCQPRSKLCVTPVATNICDWLGDNTYVIMFRQSKEIMTFLQNLRMRWRLSSKHGWVWPRVTQLGHRWVSECLTISLAGVTGPLARFLQYQAIKPSNTFLMHIRKPFSPEN